MFLSLHLKRRGFIVINCPSDADATIVKNAFQYPKGKSGTVIFVADDTDVAVMLVHQWEVTINDIYFLEEWWNKVWSVKGACRRTVTIKEHLLFLQSWSGCDSASAVFGKGKPKVAQMLAKFNEWKHLAKTVSSLWSDQADVGNASIQAFMLLYGEKDDDTLAKLRYSVVVHCSSLVHSVAFSSLMNCYGRLLNRCATSIICNSCSLFVCHSCSSFLHTLQQLYLWWWLWPDLDYFRLPSTHIC